MADSVDNTEIDFRPLRVRNFPELPAGAENGDVMVAVVTADGQGGGIMEWVLAENLVLEYAPGGEE